MKQAAFILLISLIVSIFLYANTLPSIYRDSDSHTYNRSAEYVWLLIFDFKQYPQWRKNIYSVTEIPGTSTYVRVEGD
jgi:hypothetical protein